MRESAKVTEDLLDSIASDAFAGYDPFDGLNSKLFDKSPLSRVTFFRLAWLQFHKRMPINLRPLCLVPKKRNPKGVGLMILGLLLEYERSAKPTYLAQATELGDWLLTQTSAPDQWKHACWGYHFDWQARAFYVPKGKPNIITTCYVSRALMALGKATQDSRFTESAHDSAHFIVKSLYNNDPQNPAFAYIPGEKAFVHNASLWGAALVAQIAQQTENQAYLQMAYDVAMRSVREQEEDGAWRYGDQPHHQFIDGFHTGYNLEALDIVRKAVNTTDFDQSIQKGLSYYVQNFFLDDGTPKYYHNKTLPIDMHSSAQAIITLLTLGNTQEHFELSDRVVSWTLENMYLHKEKRFIYQITPYGKNKVNYARWTQAWGYYSLAFYNRHRDKQ